MHAYYKKKKNLLIFQGFASKQIFYFLFHEFMRHPYLWINRHLIISTSIHDANDAFYSSARPTTTSPWFLLPIAVDRQVLLVSHLTERTPTSILWHEESQSGKIEPSEVKIITLQPTRAEENRKSSQSV